MDNSDISAVPQDKIATIDKPTPLAIDREPEIVLAEAQRAAAALKRVLDGKPNKVMMNNEQYLEFEDWQTLGRFYGYTVKEDGDPEPVEIRDSVGFKASAVVIDKFEVERSRATAYCMDDEEKWSTRTKHVWAYVTRSGGHSVEDPGPDEIFWEDNPNKPGKKRPRKERIIVGEERVPMFQLASMAQTRASSKALRNILSWVVVLAGYRPTPAEEIEDKTHIEPQEPTALVDTGQGETQPGRNAKSTKQQSPAPPAPPASTTHESGADGQPYTVRGIVETVKAKKKVGTNQPYRIVTVNGLDYHLWDNRLVGTERWFEILDKSEGQPIMFKAEKTKSKSGKDMLHMVEFLGLVDTEPDPSEVTPENPITDDDLPF